MQNTPAYPSRIRTQQLGSPSNLNDNNLPPSIQRIQKQLETQVKYPPTAIVPPVSFTENNTTNNSISRNYIDGGRRVSMNVDKNGGAVFVALRKGNTQQVHE
jgi:hypothetical protein